MSRFNETIKKMQDITSDIKAKADLSNFELDEEIVEKIKAVADKTIDVVNEAAVKLKSAVDRIDNEDELNNFLDRVDEKCQNAKEYAFTKINELLPEDLELKDEEKEESTMEKFMKNENVQNAANVVLKAKDALVDFYNSPETQHKINQAKLAVLTLASKGLDVVKNALEKRNNNK